MKNMTIEEFLKRRLNDCGLFESQCDQIMARVKAGPVGAPMVGRWGERPDTYPEGFMGTLWVATRREALVFVDETCPAAWFRPLLADDHDDA